MPHSSSVLLDALIRNVRFTAEHLNAVQQVKGQVTRTETSLFDVAAAQRNTESAQISFVLARRNACDLRRVSDHLDPKLVDDRLCGLLAAELEMAGHAVPEHKLLRRALDVILLRDETLLPAALRRATAQEATLRDAAAHPETFESDTALEESRANLYGVMPPDLTAWEQAFARWLDNARGTVTWWLRNVQRGGAPNAWGVGIVLLETGGYFYPDFVVGVVGRRRPHGVLLAETKEPTETDDSARKSRTEHRAYGRAMMVRHEPTRDRFTRVEFDPALGRNREVALLAEGICWLDPRLAQR